jgi:(E)-4-hydroxy-3-methylbut-2-enyl-diphosphate synthase
MGCEVNGPGEARDADAGLAFSRRHGFLFRKGKVVARVDADESIERLLEMLAEMEE